MNCFLIVSNIRHRPQAMSGSPTIIRMTIRRNISGSKYNSIPIRKADKVYNSFFIVCSFFY